VHRRCVRFLLDGAWGSRFREAQGLPIVSVRIRAERALPFSGNAFWFIVGAAFLGCASLLNYGYVFQAFGWVLVVTTAVLLFVPWKIHRKFAVFVVPRALEYTRFMGGTAMVMGAFVVFSLLGGGEI